MEATQIAALFADGGISLSGILDEMIGLLPVVIPFLITCIGLRKGISFLRGVLHSA